MGAPEGNQFWRLRSRHGCEKLFKTPELLWEAACEYFEWCEANPLKESQAKVTSLGQGGGSSIEIIELPVMRAMTLSQLCFYLGCNEAYIRQFKQKLTENDKDFATVIEDIEKIIYNQKFQGAAANLLNANLISRDLGLAERTDVTITEAPDVIAPGKKKD
jgi:hypothetical protein